VSIPRSSLAVLALVLGACTLPHARARPDDGALAERGEEQDAIDEREDSAVDDRDDVAIIDDARDDARDDGRDDVVMADVAMDDVPSMDATDAADAADATESSDASDAASDAATDVVAEGGEAGDAARDAGCGPRTADCGDGLCRPILDSIVTCVEATSDGLHVLTIGGTPFCAYCQQFGTGSRWTMVLKASGAETASPTPQRFSYDSALWTNTETLLEHNVERDQRETKSRGFFAHPLRQVLVEMSTGATTRSVVASLVAGTAPPIASLRALFAGGNNTYSPAFRVDAWLGSVPDARIQDRCRRVGINVRGNDGDAARVRIGAIGNNDLINDCDSHDSWVGVGGARGDGDDSLSFSAGNVARWNGGDNRTIRSHATVWIRE
jgi:hypothetical protein